LNKTTLRFGTAEQDCGCRCHCIKQSVKWRLFIFGTYAELPTI